MAAKRPVYVPALYTYLQPGPVPSVGRSPLATDYKSRTQGWRGGGQGNWPGMDSQPLPAE